MKKQALKDAFQNPPAHFNNMVSMTLNNLTQEKENVKMKKITLKKGIVFAALTVLALSTTALAVGKIASYTSGSSPKPEYTRLPTKQEIAKDIGVEPQLVADFTNGFAFTTGHLSDVKAKDDSGNVIAKYKTAFLYYTKGSDEIFVVINKIIAAEEKQPAQDTVLYKEIELGYYEDIYKNVPDGYQLTEQEQRDSDSGKYVFAEGGNGFETVTVQTVYFDMGSANYGIIAKGVDLTKAELFAMAQEIIDAE